MRRQVALVHLGDAHRVLGALADAGLEPVVRDALVPGWREAIAAAARRGAVIEAVPREWADPDRFCTSFTRFWNIVTR